VLSCSLITGDQGSVQDVPKDAPLSEFIIGKWKSVSAINSEGNESSYKFEIEFVDQNTVDFAWFKLEGGFLDGTTSQYSFIDSNTIFVEDKRAGDQHWLLERDGQTLIIHRTFVSEDDKTSYFIRTYAKLND